MNSNWLVWMTGCVVLCAGTAARAEGDSVMSGALRGGLIGAVAGAVIGVVVSLLKKRNKP